MSDLPIILWCAEHDQSKGHCELEDADGMYPPSLNHRYVERCLVPLNIVTCNHEELVEKIRLWAQAYPIEAFPEPDHKATGHDPTLCSASMGRHILGQLTELIDT